MLAKSKINVYANKVVKRNVTLAEAFTTSIVYPPENKELLIKAEKRKDGNGYNLHMRKLKPLQAFQLKSLTFTQTAIDMLNAQLTKLHEAGLTHSNLNARNVYKAKPTFRSLVRQILVDDDGNKTITGMYLSDFNRRNTNDTTENERKLLNKFIRYIQVKNSHITSNRPIVGRRLF